MKRVDLRGSGDRRAAACGPVLPLANVRGGGARAGGPGMCSPAPSRAATERREASPHPHQRRPACARATANKGPANTRPNPLPRHHRGPPRRQPPAQPAGRRWCLRAQAPCSRSPCPVAWHGRCARGLLAQSSVAARDGAGERRHRRRPATTSGRAPSSRRRSTPGRKSPTDAGRLVRCGSRKAHCTTEMTPPRARQHLRAAGRW
jgi:hypothetical protein